MAASKPELNWYTYISACGHDSKNEISTAISHAVFGVQLPIGTGRNNQCCVTKPEWKIKTGLWKFRYIYLNFEVRCRTNSGTYTFFGIQPSNECCQNTADQTGIRNPIAIYSVFICFYWLICGLCGPLSISLNTIVYGREWVLCCKIRDSQRQVSDRCRSV